MESSTATLAVAGQAPYARTVSAWGSFDGTETPFATAATNGTTNDGFRSYVSFDSTQLSLGLEAIAAGLFNGVTLNNPAVYAYWLIGGTPSTAANASINGANKLHGGGSAVTTVPFANVVNLNCGLLAGITADTVTGTLSGFNALEATAGQNPARWAIIVKGNATIASSTAKVMEFNNTDWVDITTAALPTVFAGTNAQLGVRIPRAAFSNPATMKIVAGAYNGDTTDADGADCDSADDGPNAPGYGFMGEHAAKARAFMVDFNSPSFPNYSGNITADTWSGTNTGRLCWTVKQSGNSVAGAAFSAYCP
jgi:hypothetical protein